MMFGFAVVATAPALLISRMISPRRGNNPVKFLPMECGQVPKGEGRTHFMMQYYAYILMFVVFDVMAIFLYAWGGTLLHLPQSATLPIIAFLGHYVCRHGVCPVPVEEAGHLVGPMDGGRRPC